VKARGRRSPRALTRSWPTIEHEPPSLRSDRLPQEVNVIHSLVARSARASTARSSHSPATSPERRLRKLERQVERLLDVQPRVRKLESRVERLERQRDAAPPRRKRTAQQAD
jgi:hypothetical protein